MLQARLIFMALCLLTCAYARAQDPQLPNGKAQIMLFSGKIIKDAVLWKVHSTTLEYLKEENLHDVPLENISYVHYPHADYELSDSNQLVRIEYDNLILLNNDTIFCFIKEINPLSYIYTQPGKTTCQSIERYNVRKHVLAGVQEIPVEQKKKVEVKPDSSTKTHGGIHAESPTLNYYAKGKADGDREFRGNGSLTGGLLLGCVPIFGWLTAPITLAVPPRTSPHDAQLYKTNKLYRQGYERAAWNKKAKRTLTGLLAGAAILFVLTIR